MNQLIKDLKLRSQGLDFASKIKLIKELADNQIVFTTSFGEEDQVITHIIFTENIDIDVVTIDTGRLFEETYKVANRTTEKYRKSIKFYFPDNQDVENLLTAKGTLSFYQSVENRKECCTLRKVKPLERALKGANCWITGLRAGQSAGRTEIEEFEFDERMQVLKYNPLYDWSLEKIRSFISENNIPVNPLHQRGFVSIGCAPCTRAISEGEDIRSGRWWWESNTNKECGLHIHQK